jgi:transcriptional regulator with XRE-family HTH domain
LRNLRARIDEKGGVAKIALELGISRTRLAKKLNNQIPFNYVEMIRIMEIIGITPLMEGTDYFFVPLENETNIILKNTTKRNKQMPRKGAKPLLVDLDPEEHNKINDILRRSKETKTALLKRLIDAEYEKIRTPGLPADRVGINKIMATLLKKE